MCTFQYLQLLPSIFLRNVHVICPGGKLVILKNMLPDLLFIFPERIFGRERFVLLATGPYYYINGLINLAIISHFCLLLFRFKRDRQRTRSSSDTVSYHLPSNWSPINPSEEFKVVELNEVLDHDEYSKVKAQFMSTMSGFNVKSVKRVQNPSLWEDYER
jgi:hypothetical protein